MTLKQPVALVFGAGRGLGRETALAFARQGYAVALYDFSPGHVEQTRQAVAALGAPALVLEGDPIKKIALQALFNQLTDAWGRLDVVVNALEANPTADVLRLDEWDWHRGLDIHLTVPFLITQVAGRILHAGGGGVVTHLLTASEGTSAGLPRRCGQAGVLALVPTAAEALGDAVRVHAVVATPLAVPCALRPWSDLPGSPQGPVEAVLALCRSEAAGFTGALWGPPQQAGL